MLKEFVESIVTLAKGSTEPRTIDLPGDKLLVVVGDTVETHVKDRVLHQDTIVSLTSLIDWCSGRDNLTIKVANKVIHASSNRSVRIERDTATLMLEHSTAYGDLLEWCDSARTVAATVKGLRSKLAGTYDASYLSVFKRLDFSRKNDGSKSVTHTGESMGKMVEMAAQSGAGEIPEVLLFRCRLFSGIPTSECDLRFAVNVDANTETVSLAPVGDCLQDAHQATRVELVGRLKSEFENALVLESA